MELEDLVNSIDIVDYISQFVELTEKNGEMWGLSPFKDEKTPSFSVRREANSFYDFSSGIGGNVFTFVRYYNKCNSSRAIEILKQYAGVEGQLSSTGNKMAATIVCKRFATPKQIRKPVSSSTLPDDFMERYSKRDEKLAVWEKEGISKQSLDRFQVRYDSFSDRLVYPVRNIDGKIVNIGGRTLDPQWKEKKLRKYTYFYEWGGGTMNTIYGLAENMEYIMQAHEVILFEGCKSVLLADTWGIRRTAALLTSHVSPTQMEILAKLGCRAVFALDKDVKIPSDHNIAKLKQFINIDYVYDRDGLLEAKDSPVDKGLEVFKSLYEKRLRYR